MAAVDVVFSAVTGFLTYLSWSKSEEYVGTFLSWILSIFFGVFCLLGLIGEPQAGGNHSIGPDQFTAPQRTAAPQRRGQRVAAHQFAAPQRTAAPQTQTGGRGNQRIQSLHTSVLDAFYKRQKGGAIISCGDNNVIAIEFDGPLPNGGIVGEMAYAKHTRGAIEAGKRFLRGETYHHIKCNESEFNSLLSKYSKQARWTGNTDVISGLRLYQVSISR